MTLGKLEQRNRGVFEQRAANLHQAEGCIDGVYRLIDRCVLFQTVPTVADLARWAQMLDVALVPVSHMCEFLDDELYETERSAGGKPDETREQATA